MQLSLLLSATITHPATLLASSMQLFLPSLFSLHRTYSPHSSHLTINLSLTSHPLSSSLPFPPLLLSHSHCLSLALALSQLLSLPHSHSLPSPSLSSNTTLHTLYLCHNSHTFHHLPPIQSFTPSFAHFVPLSSLMFILAHCPHSFCSPPNTRHVLAHPQHSPLLPTYTRSSLPRCHFHTTFRSP